METRKQRTLKKPVSFVGIGIHSGKKVSMRFLPAEEHTGILFKRTDLSGEPTIPATIEYVKRTDRSTTIGVGDCHVQTVEHVLAPLHAYKVDNLIIEISEMEPPVGDGSSQPFLSMIQEVGIEEQSAEVTALSLSEPVYLVEDKAHLIALPSDRLKVSYTLNYPKVPIIRCQYLSLDITAESFSKELASCRTFALYEEISFLMERGLIRGGSLENAVVIKDDVVISKEGLRYPDEMVRHKVLDLLGDLALVGFPFTAHFIALGSGHKTNVAMGRLLMESLCEKVS